MTLETWINENIAPNVLAVGKVSKVADENGTITYDVGVFVTTGENTVKRQTQPVYEIAGAFHFGSNIIKNWEATEPTKSPEQALIEFLDTSYGEANYVIHPPVDTSSGKAAVVTINDSKKIIARIGDNFVAKNFSEV